MWRCGGGTLGCRRTPTRHGHPCGGREVEGDEVMTESPTLASKVQPRTITHVGVTVPNAEEAIAWYQSVLGFQLMIEPQEYTAGEGYFGRLVADMLGPHVV